MNQSHLNYLAAAMFMLTGVIFMMITNIALGAVFVALGAAFIALGANAGNEKVSGEDDRPEVDR